MVFTYSEILTPSHSVAGKHRECARLTKKADYLRICFDYEVIPVIIFLNQKTCSDCITQMSFPDVTYTCGRVLEGAEDVIYTWGEVMGQEMLSIHVEEWQRQRNTCPNCVGFVLLCARIEHRACYVRQGLYHWIQLQPNQILEQT